MNWVDRQLPEGDEVFLDHVGFFVPDLESAGLSLARLGFQVSPVNVHYNEDERGNLVPAGTSNRVALLHRGFLEMLAATSPTPLADQLKSALKRYPGLHLIALTHQDMIAQRERLLTAGFRMLPIVNLRRRLQTDEGERLMMYSVLRTDTGQMAEGRVQMLTHHTAELLWTPEATLHENRAEALTDLLICVDDPFAVARRFGRFAGRAVTRGDDGPSIDLDRGRLLLVGPDEADRVLPDLILPDLPYIAGVALRSTDIAATRRVLDKNRIRPVQVSSDLICVGPTDALGAYLLFHSASVDEPWLTLRDHRVQVQGTRRFVP